MRNKLWAIASSLSLAAGNLEELIWSHALHSSTETEETSSALGLLQKSTNSHRESSRIGEVSNGRDVADGHSVVARINARFSNGRPSTNLDEAGVVVHAFDGSNAGSDGWFAAAFHWSASIINARVPYMYLGNPENDLHDLHAGIVISSEFAAASLLCTYDHDGVTSALQPCELQAAPVRDCIPPPCPEQPDIQCVPGCVGLRFDAPIADQTVRQWCGSNATEQDSSGGKTTNIIADDHCAWPPSALDAMMHQQEVFVREGSWDSSCTMGPDGCRPYNEVILNPGTLRHRLPQAVEAIYFVTGSAALTPQHRINGEKQAKTAQRLFWQMYKQRVPIVRFTSFSSQAPFEFASEVSE